MSNPLGAPEAVFAALANPDLTGEQRNRLLNDLRLIEPCQACGCPGYYHAHADEQYDVSFYGMPRFEAGDIECENPECTLWNSEFGVHCGWYEGSNWQRRK